MSLWLSPDPYSSPLLFSGPWAQYEDEQEVAMPSAEQMETLAAYAKVRAAQKLERRAARGGRIGLPKTGEEEEEDEDEAAAKRASLRDEETTILHCKLFVAPQRHSGKRKRDKSEMPESKSRSIFSLSLTNLPLLYLPTIKCPRLSTIKVAPSWSRRCRKVSALAEHQTPAASRRSSSIPGQPRF